MIDLHSHCLPGIDDGAKNVKESVEMLLDSFSQGVTVCVGTPHITVHWNEDISDFLQMRAQSFEMLAEALKDKMDNVPVILCGAEVYIDNDISEYKDLKKLCIEGTDYLLVEMSFVEYNEMYSEWLYSLNTKGITPIIAHVERYPYYDRLIEEISDLNVVYQVNAKTLLKSKGRKFLSYLLQSGKTVVVSSDMHNMGQRKSCIKKAYDSISSQDPQTAAELFNNNAKMILQNKNDRE